jgi:rhodanese-related sulfurtransferase
MDFKNSTKECSSNSTIELEDSSIVISLDELIEENKKSSLKNKNLKEVNITKKIRSVEVKFKGKLFTIQRRDIRECPPFCISPFEIDGIKGVGELETIEFIKSLEKKRGRILVDARGVGEFKQSTIPTAINIPYNILDPKSRYKDKILKLLGAVKLKKGWYFKKSYKLLIFDNGVVDTKAKALIERLIEYGYPKSKMLYYRGGLDSWKSLGLSTI